ncbi:MAG: universal stress protein [Thermodesulfovibrionales bacterium]|jgi:hypothetical protein
MGRIGKKFEDLMSAISFAEEGDLRTAGEILKERRGGLIAVKGDETDAQALRYALHTCKRIGAELRVLSLASPAVDDLLRQFQAELEREKISYRISRKEGCLKKEIIDYTNTEKDVLFVVVGSEDDPDRECRGKEKRLSDAWQRLRCPLVVVTGAAQG